MEEGCDVNLGWFNEIIGKVKGLIWGKDIYGKLGVKAIQTDEMDRAIQLWRNIGRGAAPWVNASDGIATVNMAKHVADTRAKLVTLDIGIAVGGENERAEYLQGIADELIDLLPNAVERAEMLGGMMIRYNGTSWDFAYPTDFKVTSASNGRIDGCVFSERIEQGDALYTRLEYHRFDGDEYVITHTAYKGKANNKEIGNEIKLTDIAEWADIEPESRIKGIKSPLFGYYRVSGVNHIDTDSPLGVSVFANAIEELKALDVSISRKNEEIEDSKHITFVGLSMVKAAGANGVSLPRFVKGIGIGVGDDDISQIKEHVPTVLTDERIRDINFNLSMLGIKCGFSAGTFCLDGKNGVMTATQVEADDRDTLMTVKNDRDALKVALSAALEGASQLATIMGTVTDGEVEYNYNFGDITYNYEEDREHWISYVRDGWIPVWKYLVKFEGMTEDEAKELSSGAANAADTEIDNIISQIE